MTLMRKMSAVLFAAVLMLPAAVKAGVESFNFRMKQEVCDTVRYEIAYDMTFVKGVWTDKVDTLTEPMRLEIGDRAMRFYSYAAFRSDSLNAVNAANGSSAMLFGENVSWQVYRNYPKDGCFTFLDDVSCVNYYAVTEPVKSPEWTPVADSVATILGYQCCLATAWYKGRQWFVWYADDIPMDAGPWKLCGLPGLILRAYDAKRQYVFEATGLRNVTEPKPMMYQGLDYEPVSTVRLRPPLQSRCGHRNRRRQRQPAACPKEHTVHPDRTSINNRCNMKKCLISIMAVVSLLPTCALAGTDGFRNTMRQETCDTVRYMVAYDMTYVNDTTKAEWERKTEPMRLEIGDKSTKFYSYTAYLEDSLNAKREARGEQLATYTADVTWQVYRNYPKEGSFTFLDDLIAMNYYAVTEPMKSPEWTPVADSTATILGNECHLATAWYKGRRWFAWYADDVPMDAGPWKLCGLPGLILRAYDAGRQYVFEATAMRNVTDGTPIMYQGLDYEPVTFSQLMTQYERYYADPIGYLALFTPGMMTADDGKNASELNTPKNLPFNPIELAE